MSDNCPLFFSFIIVMGEKARGAFFIHTNEVLTMLKPYCVTFAGHREIDCFTDVEKRLYQIIADIIRTKEYVEFYVGIEGDFD